MTGEQVFYDDIGVGEQMRSLTVTVDKTQLFFFSAATYNGHRIHYDKQWAQSEGYDDVLVHGPLQAALLVGPAVWCHSRCRTGLPPFPARR
jgi:hydroxyacyl-ACP dehydratase HTD2-like protein with hotdog domain